jgi:hypothetical protein
MTRERIGEIAAWTLKRKVEFHKLKAPIKVVRLSPVERSAIPPAADSAPRVYSDFACMHARFCLDGEDRLERLPSCRVANAMRAEIYESIQRQFEVPRNLVISVRNPHGDELCLGDRDRPVQFAIELLTIEPGPPRFLLRVTQGAERPNLKIAVPVLHGGKGSVLLYRHE